MSCPLNPPVNALEADSRVLTKWYSVHTMQPQVLIIFEYNSYIFRAHQKTQFHQQPRTLNDYGCRRKPRTAMFSSSRRPTYMTNWPESTACHWFLWLVTSSSFIFYQSYGHALQCYHRMSLCRQASYLWNDGRQPNWNSTNGRPMLYMLS